MKTHLQASKGTIFRKVWTAESKTHKLFVYESKLETAIVYEHQNSSELPTPEEMETRFFQMYPDASEITQEQFEAAYDRVHLKLKLT